jgi:hypothetical protein
VSSQTISFSEPVQPAGSQLATCFAGKAAIGRVVDAPPADKLPDKSSFSKEKATAQLCSATVSVRKDNWLFYQGMPTDLSYKPSTFRCEICGKAATIHC